MRRLARSALAGACATLACHAVAGDFTGLGALSQGQFHDLSRDLGAAFAYKGVTPATTLGTLGFDVGVELTQTRMEHSSLFALAGAGGQSQLLVPKLHVHKGLPFGLDVGAFVGAVTDVDATLFGAELRYALVEDGLATPAVGLRLSGTKTSGLGPLEVTTAAADVTVSKRFTLLTPYAGGGIVRVESTAGGAGLARERFSRSRYFGGLNVNLVALNLAFEAEKMGENLSLSAKVGWRF